jgi:hypothetical protein
MPKFEKTFPVKQKPIKDAATAMQTVEELVKALDKIHRQVYDAISNLENSIALPTSFDHALASHLDYASSGHTGFQPAGSGLLTEVDPVFTAHAAYGVTSTKISHWDTAYSWGSHAAAGYLTSFTELDPVFTAWLGTVTPANWNTAYGWGNHAGLYLPLAGGTMAGAIALGGQNITGGGTITGGNLTLTGSTIQQDASTAADFTLQNLDQDKDIVFNVNYGGSQVAVAKFRGDKESFQGLGCTASGVKSFAWNASTASGASSFALGATAGKQSCTASADNAVAIGAGALVTSKSCIAFGYSSRASSATGTDLFASAALGYVAQASGDLSLAIGACSTASNAYSLAIGYSAVASGLSAKAIGAVTASNNKSIAIGDNFTNNLASTFQVGYGQADFQVSANSVLIPTTSTLTIGALAGVLYGTAGAVSAIVGVSGSFTTVDSKTVTVTNGVITAIV